MLRYALRCWPYVENALLDGRLVLDNNIAERPVKPFAIGRKNLLPGVLFIYKTDVRRF